MTATSKLTLFWQETAGYTTIASFLTFVLFYISIEVAAVFFFVTILAATAVILALIADGIRRLFRKLIGYRVRIVIERVR